MYSKRVLLLLLAGFLLFSLSFDVSAQSLLDDVFSVFEGVDMADIYQSYQKVIDFFLYLILFMGVAQAALFKRFEGRAGKAISVAMGISLSLSLVMFTDFSIASFGPIAAAIFVILVAMVLFNLINTVVNDKVGSAAFAFLITYYLLKAVVPNLFAWIQDTPGLGLIRALLGIAVLISLYTIFRFLWDKLAPSGGLRRRTEPTTEPNPPVEPEPPLPLTSTEGTIRVHVTDPDGNNIPNAAIHTERRGSRWNPRNWGGWRLQNYTAQNGELEFNINQGNVNIRSSKQGYQPSQVAGNVVVESTINVSIVLTPVKVEVPPEPDPPTGEPGELKVEIVTPGKGDTFKEGDAINFEAKVTGGSTAYNEHEKAYLIYFKDHPDHEIDLKPGVRIPDNGVVKKRVPLSPGGKNLPARPEPYLIGVLIHDKETTKQVHDEVEFYIKMEEEPPIESPIFKRLIHDDVQYNISNKDKRVEPYKLPRKGRARVFAKINGTKDETFKVLIYLENKDLLKESVRIINETYPGGSELDSLFDLMNLPVGEYNLYLSTKPTTEKGDIWKQEHRDVIKIVIEQEITMKPQIVRFRYEGKQVDVIVSKREQIYEYPNKGNLTVICNISDKKGYKYDAKLLLRNKDGEETIKDFWILRRNQPFEAGINLEKRKGAYELVLKAAYNDTKDFIEDFVNIVLPGGEGEEEREAPSDDKKVIPELQSYVKVTKPLRTKNVRLWFGQKLRKRELPFQVINLSNKGQWYHLVPQVLMFSKDRIFEKDVSSEFLPKRSPIKVKKKGTLEYFKKASWESKSGRLFIKASEEEKLKEVRVKLARFPSVRTADQEKRYVIRLFAHGESSDVSKILEKPTFAPVHGKKYFDMEQYEVLSKKPVPGEVITEAEKPVGKSAKEPTVEAEEAQLADAEFEFWPVIKELRNKSGWYQFTGTPKQRPSQGFKIPKTEDVNVTCVINAKKGMPLTFRVQLQLKMKNEKGETVSLVPICDKQEINIREEITCSFNPSKLGIAYYDLELLAHMIGPKSEVIKTNLDTVNNLFFYEKHAITSVSEKPPALITLSDEDYKKKHYLVEGVDDMGIGWVDKKSWIHPRFPGHSHKSARVKELKGIISKLRKYRQSLKYLFDEEQNPKSYVSLQNYHDRIIKRLESILSLYGSSDGMKRLKMDSTFKVGTINIMIKGYLNTLKQENWNLWINYLSTEYKRMDILKNVVIDPAIKNNIDWLHRNFAFYYDLLNKKNKNENDFQEIKNINNIFKNTINTLMGNVVNYLKKDKAIKELMQYRSFISEKKISEFPGLAKA